MSSLIRTPRAFFSGRKFSNRYASEELRDWLADHGPVLTASQFHAQHREHEPIHPYDY